MMCEAVDRVGNYPFNKGIGCNISVSESDGVCDGSQFDQAVSFKSLGFLDHLIRKNVPKSIEKKPKETQNSWSNIFSRKSSSDRKNIQEDEDTAKLIEQMELEGRSEADINMHLSHINDIHEAPPSSPKEKKNVISQWFREVQQAIKEEFGFAQPYYPEYECDLRGLTVSISSGPFYSALPPDMDMTYEELSSLEPVYVGSKCINNLPSCKYDGTALPGDQTNCPVCLCEFTKGENLKSLPCVHFFHTECIDSWLMVGHSCPVCKRLVE